LAFAGTPLSLLNTGSVNADCLGFIRTSTSIDCLTSVPHIVEGNLLDLVSIAPGETIAADPLVDDRVVVPDDIVVHHRGVVVDLLGFGDSVSVMIVPPSAEAATADE